MKDHVYKIIELTGTSTTSIEDAVGGAIQRAHKTIKNERHAMHLLFSPVLASAIWIGGVSVGLILVIIVVVILLRS